MEQHTIFDYKPSRKSKINLVVFSILAIFPICWGTLIITLPLMLLSDEIFSLSLPSMTPYLVFFLFIILLAFNMLNTRLRRLTIIKEEITWETSFKKLHSAKKENITKFEWKYNWIILNQKIKIYTSSLPKKDKILLGEVLLNWLPDDALNFDDLQFRNNKAEYLPNKEFGDQTICAESNKHKNLFIRRLAIRFSIVLIPLGFYVFTIDQQAGRIFLFLSGVILIIFFAVWINTTYQAIQVNHNGITYQRGRKSHTYNWQNIEAIAIELRYRQFLIWENNKQRKLSYSHIKTENANEVANAIFQQTLIHDIPFRAL